MCAAKSFVFTEGAQVLRLSPLFHEDAQLFKLINLSILGCCYLAAGKDHSMATPDSIFGARVRGRFGTEQIAITRCHTRGSVRLRRPKRSKSRPPYPSDAHGGKKGA